MPKSTPPADEPRVEKGAPRLPILSTRKEVVFPRAVVRVTISRRENRAVFAGEPGATRQILAVPVRDPDAELSAENLCPIGTLCEVLDRTRLADGSQVVVLQGRKRVRIVGSQARAGYLAASCEQVPLKAVEVGAAAFAMDQSLQLCSRLLAFSPQFGIQQPQALFLYAGDAANFADQVPTYVRLPYAASRCLLQELDPLARLEILNDHLRAQLVLTDHVQITDGPAAPGPANPDGARRGKLERRNAKDSEVRAFENRIEASGMSEAACRHALHELGLYHHAAPGSSDTAISRKYIEWLLTIPWNRTTQDPRGEFERVADSLNASHVGLADVKNRVAEFLAVRQMNGRAGGTVLCFLGPPGTGKTSMGRAVARALGRQFIHIPLGGITEESELRGMHYSQLDSMPGLILQGMIRAGSMNPVILLDEIDKVQFGSTGETAGALLEILDPDHNREFLDHYLGVPFDLSQCMFLATANDTEPMPEALLDRVEVIEFGSYTEAEKLLIARDHLIPRAREHAGLTKTQFRVSPGALVSVIRKYTEEAGVRQFQRQVDSLARKAALAVVRGKDGLQVRKDGLLELLGPAIIDEELQMRRPLVGVALGLAWTSAGGAMLPIETVAMPGTGRIILTGSVGDVMRESVQTALSYVRGCFSSFGLEPDILETLDVHLHFPGGSTPKDGPSAGIAIATSLVSLFTKVPARHDVAMTGEMSLHGAVLPVGGLRDKVLAAMRVGIRTIIVPSRNGEEILRLPADVRKCMTLHLVDHVREALPLALRFDRSSGSFLEVLGPRRAKRSARHAAGRKRRRKR